MAADRKSPERFSLCVPSAQDRNLKRRSIALYLLFAIRSSLARLPPVPARCPSAANAFGTDRLCQSAVGASCPRIPCESKPRNGLGILCDSHPSEEYILSKCRAAPFATVSALAPQFLRSA